MSAHAIGGHGRRLKAARSRAFRTSSRPIVLSSHLSLQPGAPGLLDLEPHFLSSPRWRIDVYVCELTKRRYRGKKPREIRGPDDVVVLVGRKLRKENREHFLVLLL